MNRIGGHRSECPRTNPSSGVRRHVQRGVTLLEVVFSIGIVSVGLLGVLIIVPLAGTRSAQGMIADGGDRTGRNAIRLFDVHHMRQPSMWTNFQPTGTPAQTYLAYGMRNDVDSTNDARVSFLWKRSGTYSESWQLRPFCIDPLFISKHVEDAKLAGTNVQAETAYFPYFLPSSNYFQGKSAPRMDRISLRTVPGGASGMSFEQAVATFLGDDDLVFRLPDDRTKNPEQVFDPSWFRRQSEGRFSWLATVAPLWSSYSSAIDVNIVPDAFVLSIVVFHRRDLSMPLAATNPVSSDGPDAERLVTVSTFYSEGYAGGDVQLSTRLANPPRPATDLEVREGEWVMLSALVTSGAQNIVPVFRWYRVMATDDVQGTGPYTRNVTLQGFDWDDVARRMTTGGTASQTQATLLNGVVAVYEKTIRLETSSLWTN